MNDKIRKENDDEEEEKMPAVLEREKNKGLNVNLKKLTSKVPHLNVVNGIAQIDPANPLQKKWFELFKK